MPSALIIGDSHVHATAFGYRLEKKLKDAGWDVKRAGLGATSTASWTGGHPCVPKTNTCYYVKDLPKGTDLLLICLGTNDSANANRGKLNLPKYAEKVAGRIVELAKTFGAKRTLWIMPPWQRGNKDWYKQDAADILYTGAPLAEAQGVETFDSRPATKDLVMGGDGDGIHPGNKGGEAWATAVMEQVNNPKPPKGSLDTSVAPSESSTILLAGGVALIAGLLFWRLKKG